MSERQKVLFVQKNADGEFETESIWCLRDNDNYIIDNIPFVAKRVSLGDTIKAEYDASENAFYFDDFITVSGNTTVRLYFDDESLIEDVRKELNNFGCESEGFLQRKIVAVNVPQNIDYRPVKQYLDSGEQKKIWTYEESCLAHEY